MLLVPATGTSYQAMNCTTGNNYKLLQADRLATRQNLSEEFPTNTRQYGLDGRFTSSIIPHNVVNN